MRKPLLPVVLFFLFLFILFDRQFASADCRSFSYLLDNGSYAVADRTGSIVSSCNENKSLVPASIIKIPLALAAFNILGADFRFRTELYLDQQKNLYIKGYGDPFLVSEEVELIVDQLIRNGVQEVKGIFIDDKAFDLAHQVPGLGRSDNPFDVPVNPVVVNFNTVNIQVLAHGDVESAEPQTPKLPIMKDIGKSLPPGKYRLNICQKNCLPEKQSARYTAELFHALLKKKGVKISSFYDIRKVPEGATRIYVHKNTKRLEDIVYSFLKFSNNLIANQVFLRCGIEQFGLPATWEKSRQAVSESLSSVLGPNAAAQIKIEEGAGLSRNNRVTATAMLKVLNKFKPYSHLMQEKKNASMKSGTLIGVYNYAGYIEDEKSFVILLNQKRNTRDEVMENIKSQDE